MNTENARVSTIELFFDLVFVFTVTRVTHLVEHAHAAFDYMRAFLVLLLVWWIYAGYAWLTNGAGAARRMRPVLIAAMAGFLVMALSIPTVFHGSGVVFGLSYLFVVLLHLAAFYSLGGPGVGRATLRLAPFNVGAAVLALIAGLLHTEWSWLLFLAAAAVLAIATMRHSERGFPINAPHFVERHGLILIIALGESIVAVGSGAAERTIDGKTLLAIVLSLVLIAGLWWSYFDADDTRAEHALMATMNDNRALLAIRAFWYPFLTMIFGIVITAAGLRRIVAEQADAAAMRPAWLLPAGVMLYLAGNVWFRSVVDIQPKVPRAVTAAVVIAVGVMAARWGGIAELALITGTVLALLLAEVRLSGTERHEDRGRA